VSVSEGGDGTVKGCRAQQKGAHKQEIGTGTVLEAVRESESRWSLASSPGQTDSVVYEQFVFYERLVQLF
jgi:hypothetical protein